MAKKIMGDDGQVYVQKKKGGCLKNILIGIVAIFILVGVVNALGGNKEKNTSKQSQQTTAIASSSSTTTSSSKTESKKEEASSISQATPKNNVSTEFKNALKKAETYAKFMSMSKISVYNQLTSEHGEKFPAEAAQYAIDNLQGVDWNKNALNKAETYSSTMHMSKISIYNQLTSEHGEQFTPEESQYAIDTLKADYNQNALEKAKTYQDMMSMSIDSIREQLTSEHGEQFTPEEAEYAIQHLGD